MIDTIREQLQHTLGPAYALEQELGGGGMSRVFVATDTALARRVVVKVLAPELTAGVDLERFKREILLAAQLQHPHIVPVLTAGASEGVPWFTMPFVDGQSLRHRLASGPSLSIRETLGLLRDVAKALTYAHEHGVVHRDIKPDNILLADGTATVADFGIAKALNASRQPAPGDTLTQVGTSIGTPAYMSPEQAAGDGATDHRTDLYAFGCVAYEMLAGRPPFVEASAQRLLAAHMATEPTPISRYRADTPVALADLVMQCLQKDAGDRPQTARHVVERLEMVSTTGDAPAGDRPGAFRRALTIYALASAAVAVVAKAAIVGVGLPTWVLPGALIVMALGLPALLWTAYVRRVARGAAAGQPARTPGGGVAVGVAMPRGTMATLALKASPRTSWRRTARGGAFALGLFAAVVAGAMGLRAMGIGPEGSLFATGDLAARDRLLMSEFTVDGADASLGRVVSDAVRAGIAQSNVISMMTLSEISDALKRMAQPTDARLDLTLARAMAVREGVKAVVDGSVTAVGSSYIVSARLVTADSGRELASYRETATSADGIIPAVDELSRKLRARMGESLRAVNGAPPLSQVTTSSLEALKRYSASGRANNQSDYLTAIRELREAVAIDSLFADGWRMLAVNLKNANFREASVDSALHRAFALRDRLSERERDNLEIAFYTNGSTADRGRAIAAQERRFAAGDSSVANNLANLIYERREFARADSLYRLAYRRRPSLLILRNLINGLERQGRWVARDSAAEELRRAYPTSADVGRLKIYAMEQSGDVKGLRAATDSALLNPDPRRPSAVQVYAANLAAAEGRLNDQLRLRAKAASIDSAQGFQQLSIAARFGELGALRELGLPTGPQVAAAAAAWQALRRSGQQPTETSGFLSAAEAFASSGRVELARELLQDYARVITDTAVLRNDLPDKQRALAAIAQAERRWADAVKLYRAADSLPDGPNGRCAYCLPLDLLRVFATAGLRDSAIAQYEAYRADPYLSRPRVGPDLKIPVADLEAVARLYDARGDTAKAVTAYRDFVDRLTRADPIMQPRVAAARARLATLTPVERTRR